MCSDPVCLRITLGAPGSDPTLEALPAAGCPAPGVLPRAIDLIWGNLAAVRFDAGQTKVGAVNQVICSDTADVHLFDNSIPAPLVVDFFLARESTVPDYGSSSTALARVPDSGDCP